MLTGEAVRKIVEKVSMLVMSAAFAAPACAQTPTFASSTGNDKGDHFRLTTDVNGFTPLSTVAPMATSARCAGKDSTYSKIGADAEFVYVKFYKVFEPKSADTCPATTAGGVTVAPPRPHPGSIYKIAVTDYAHVDVKSNGLAFGALVVPFKFRLGSDKKLVSSTTIAPYIGMRWAGFQSFGFECMPVASAGLALVPITPPGETNTETRAAFSTALGFTVSSSKHADFSAGILIGKDYLNKNDRIADPSVNKAWISIWLGISK